MSNPTPHVQLLILVANKEYDDWSKHVETDPKLEAHIHGYCHDVGLADFDDVRDFQWSATFISWCFKQAGAVSSEFHFSEAHAVFVHDAIANAMGKKGVFRAYPITDYAPKLGDLIHRNQPKGNVTFDDARTNSKYHSHSAIVVDFVVKDGIRHAVTIGGNESQSVGKRYVELTSDGKVAYQKKDPFISVMENLKSSSIGADTQSLDSGPAIPVAPQLSHLLLTANEDIQMIAEGRRAPLIRGRDAGEAVGVLQDALDALFDPRFRVNAGPNRGTFGPATEKAVSALQAAAGIDVDGKAGQDTLRALDEALKKKTGPNPALPQSLIADKPPALIGKLLGTDGNALVSSSSVWNGNKKSLLDWCNQALGGNPGFWGRYFKGPGNPSEEQYQASKENFYLNQLGIRVLATARQTTEVGGSEASGRAAGLRNTNALFEAFPADHLASKGAQFLFFLDVEPTHPLSEEYYAGWANEVIGRSQILSDGRVAILPAVYLNHGDKSTYSNLAKATMAGIPCHGLWVAAYLKNTAIGAPKIPDWDPNLTEHPHDPARVLIWQYAGDCYGKPNSGPLDFNLANPKFQNECFSLLIPTPPS